MSEGKCPLGEDCDLTLAYMMGAEKAKDTIKALRAEVDRLQGNMRAELGDHIHGTPCAQIRWQQEREELQAENKRLRAALLPFAKAADNFDGYKIGDPEEWFANAGMSDGGDTRIGAITVGDLRRARALAAKPAHTDDKRAFLTFANSESAAQTAPNETIETYFERQIEWSRATFGPNERTKGIIDHITKELREVAAEPRDLSEWVDLIILSMDGFWRHGGTAAGLLPLLMQKQRKNMARQWPDWRTVGDDKAIEHDRSHDHFPMPPLRRDE